MSAKTLLKGENCCFVENKSSLSDFASIEKSNAQTIVFANPPTVVGKMSVVGEREGKGPLGRYFQKVVDDDKLGEKTFEKAEYDLLESAVYGAIDDANMKNKEVGVMVAGDLLNQITSSSYVARELAIPYLGVYGACSTMCESLLVGATLLNSGAFDSAVCATVSHFATAERQFRYPLEYGCQRPPYAQWTVTGAGATVIKSGVKNGIKIVAAVVGRVIDFGTNDLNNMGAAMAPAAADTMSVFFKETHTKPSDYDLILTGDLGKLGSDILRDLMRERGFELGRNYNDCGCLVYDNTQKCYQGGSGCGCSASVLNSFVFNGMEKGKYNRIALFATGALMSTQSCYQGETIPCISHGIIFEVKNDF